MAGMDAARKDVQGPSASWGAAACGGARGPREESVRIS